MASERKTAREVYADNPVEAYINGVIDKDELIDALLKERGYEKRWTVPASGAYHVHEKGEYPEIEVPIYAPAVQREEPE